MSNDVNILDDLVEDNATEATNVDTEATESTDTSNEVTETTESTESTNESVLTELPEGVDVKSITDFAAFMSTELLKEVILSGGEPDPTKHYVVPQSVYQTVKNQKDPIPHIKVQAPGEDQARVYILVTEATEWWKARAERLSTRGQGSARASSREPEDNMRLLSEAVKANLHALARKDLWTERVETSAAKVEKYRGFLGEQKVSEEDVVVQIQTATDEYNAEVAEKAASRKRKTDESDNN